MAVVRIIAWILLALGFMFLGADAVSTMEAGVPVVRTLAEVIDLIGPTIPTDGEGPLGGAGKGLLEAPMWLVVGVPGLLLTLIFRPVD